MNDPKMHEERLSAALQSLPREQAGLGFTTEVLRRIEEPVFVLPVRWATAVTAAALVILTLGFGWREWHHRQAAEDLRLLLVEKQALEAELEALRQLTARARPTVYLGGDDNVDLVLDLARFKRQGGFGSNPSWRDSPLPTATGSSSTARPRNATAEHRLRNLPEDQTVRPLRVVY